MHLHVVYNSCIDNHLCIVVNRGQHVRDAQVCSRSAMQYPSDSFGTAPEGWGQGCLNSINPVPDARPIGIDRQSKPGPFDIGRPRELICRKGSDDLWKSGAQGFGDRIVAAMRDDEVTFVEQRHLRPESSCQTVHIGPFAGIVDSLNNAYLRVLCERCGGPDPVAWMWLSAYGVDQAKLDERQADWKAMLARVLPERA